jgi:hypothetical protein
MQETAGVPASLSAEGGRGASQQQHLADLNGKVSVSGALVESVPDAPVQCRSLPGMESAKAARVAAVIELSDDKPRDGINGDLQSSRSSDDSIIEQLHPAFEVASAATPDRAVSDIEIDEDARTIAGAVALPAERARDAVRRRAAEADGGGTAFGGRRLHNRGDEGGATYLGPSAGITADQLASHAHRDGPSVNGTLTAAPLQVSANVHIEACTGGGRDAPLSDQGAPTHFSTQTMTQFDSQRYVEAITRSPAHFKALHIAANKVQQLSALGHGMLQSTFEDLFQGIEGLESTEEIRIDHETRSNHRDLPLVNKTVFNNPPVPRTEVPADPCTDPDAGAPSLKDKRAAKCTITHSPQCYKLQERFLLIQAGIEDERDELQEEIEMLERYCEETKKTLETQIENDLELLAQAQTKLAQATEKEADAGEEARQTDAENTQLNSDLKKQMKSCSSNYINFETEICALKKIRGEIYKLKGTNSPFFQDCEVGKWNPEECTKSCSGGEQKLTRSILNQAEVGSDGGAKCLPLEAMRSCNNQPCPIDCKLEAWTGWSKCSAPCGGGVMQRLREVKVAMKYGGHPCSTTSETRSCNNQACEKDCELTDWTAWSDCSKDCDGGTMKRQKFIKEAAEGQGKCPGEWSRNRLEYMECALHRCDTDFSTEPIKCNTTLDVILLIDGSGSLGKSGWNAEIQAAKNFVDAFKDANKVEMAVILFSGPRTWSGVSKCTGHAVASASLESCGIQQVTHYTEDLNKVTNLLNGLDWPQGSTLTSLALLTAKAEMTLGRGDIHTVVVVLTDGRPLSYRKTTEASKLIRKQARLIWVPITRFAPLSKIKEWATRRWQENVVIVKDFDELEKPEVVTHIIANMCPKKEAKVYFERR